MDFGKKLKSVIEEKNISQIRFAEMVQMNYTHCNKFFTGRKPNVDFLLKIIRVFPDIDLKWLLLDNKEYSQLIGDSNSNLEDYSFSDLKSLYDFLDSRKNIVIQNTEHFENEDVQTIINKQKIIWIELNNRIENINGLTLKTD